MALSVLAGIFALAVACVVPGFSRAEGDGYSDADIKEKFVFISRLIHGDENGSHIKKALRMAGNDTNRFARVLRELAEENTNQTVRAIRNLGIYKTPQSLPFLYSYATNATCGAEALKAIFAIEGVTSNSLAATRCYLALTNDAVLVERGGSIVCGELVRCSMQGNVNECCRTNALDVVYTFVTTSNKNYYWLDKLLKDYDPSYRYSRRRLCVPRSFSLPSPYEFQINYVTNAINELVAYPEANLPE